MHDGVPMTLSWFAPTPNFSVLFQFRKTLHQEFVTVFIDCVSSYKFIPTNRKKHILNEVLLKLIATVFSPKLFVFDFERIMPF